jgi:pilus assembly protein FimV
MGIRYVCLSGAAVLIFVATAFAQTTGQTPAQTPGQTAGQTETQITLVGCLQREADYRRAQSSGRGGVVGTGAGLTNEFILVNASTATGTTGSAAAPDATGTAGTTTGTSTTGTSTTPGTATPAGTTPADTPASSAPSADCATATGSGEAYELTGTRERELERFVGRRVEITGTLKPAATASDTAGTTGAAGTAKPTGGFDPMGQDLKLREVNVGSFREVAATRPPAPEPETSAQAAAPAPQAATPSEPEPQAVGTSGTQQELPRTASPLPIAGLIGLLSLGGAVGIRSMRRR